MLHSQGLSLNQLHAFIVSLISCALAAWSVFLATGQYAKINAFFEVSTEIRFYYKYHYHGRIIISSSHYSVSAYAKFITLSEYTVAVCKTRSVLLSSSTL